MLSIEIFKLVMFWKMVALLEFCLRLMYHIFEQEIAKETGCLLKLFVLLSFIEYNMIKETSTSCFQEDVCNAEDINLAKSIFINFHGL